MKPSKTSAVVAALTTLALSPVVPAAAQDGQVISGPLSKVDAHDFIKRQLPEEAAKLLLGDERADFYSVRKGDVHVERPKRCGRIDRSQVNCRYRVKLRPDKAHRKANWFPIQCKGSIDVARLANGGLGGEPGNYRCVTIGK